MACLRLPSSILFVDVSLDANILQFADVLQEWGTATMPNGGVIAKAVRLLFYYFTICN